MTTTTVLDVRGTTVAIHTAGPRVTVTEHTIPPGFGGPPLHVHPGFDEVFLVRSGVLTLRLGDAVEEIGPGGGAEVPGALAHTFANESAEPVRFLCVMTPGGFDAYFRALADGDEAGAAEAAGRFGYRAAPGGASPYGDG